MAGAAILTRGAIAMICSGLEVIEPVLQVSDLRRVRTAQSTIDRYRMILSDGDHVMQAMLATQMNELVTAGELRKGSIVQLDEFTYNVIQGRSIIIVISLVVLVENYELIGSPISFVSEPPVTMDLSDAPTASASATQQGSTSGNSQSHSGAVCERNRTAGVISRLQAETGPGHPLGGQQTPVQQAREQPHLMDRIKALREELLDEMDRMDAEYCIQMLQLRRDSQARERELEDEWTAKHTQLIEFLKQRNPR